MKRLSNWYTTGIAKHWIFLITKFRSFVRMKARSYFLIGADREDIVQEGMIGLYKASVTLKGTSYHRFGLLLNYVLHDKLLLQLKQQHDKNIFL